MSSTLLTPGLAPDPAHLDPEQRALARRALSALGVLSVFSITGVASSLYLVGEYPLLLIAMSPLGRHLFLVAPIVDPVAFVVVAVVRRLVFFVACFHLGKAMGPTGVVWLEQRSPLFARFVRWMEALFSRYARIVTFCFAGPTVSSLAGMSGMPLRRFVSLAGCGLVLRMLGILLFAEMLREPIETALEWIARYRLPGTALLVVGILLWQWRRIRVQRSAATEPASPADQSTQST